MDKSSNDDIRVALRQRGLNPSEAEFVIDNAKLLDRTDRLRDELGVEPRDD